MNKFTIVMLCVFILCSSGYTQGNYWGACTQGDFTNEATAMDFDAQNNAYVTGYITGESAFSTNVTFNSAQGNGDIYVAKYSPQGALLWAKKYGGAFSDRAYDIKVDGQGNILVTGQFFGTINFDGNTLQSVGNSKDIFLIKMTPAGDVIWAISEGGSMAENVYALAVDNQNNIILTGQFQGTAQIGGQTVSSVLSPNLGTPSYDLFVSKYDSNGNPLWVIVGAAPYEDRGMALVTDSQNNIYVSGQFSDTLQFAGQTFNNMGYNVGFLAKLSPSGGLLWFNRMTGGMVLPYDLAINTQGEVHVCGDFLGSLIHQTNFGNQTLTNAFSRKVFAMKVSSAGQVIWQRALGSNSEISARGIAIDNSGKIFIGGHFRCALTELQNQNTALFNSVGFRDIYLWTIGADGTIINTKQMGGKKNDYCYDVVINAGNTLFMCGSFTNSLYLPPNNNVTYSTNAGTFGLNNNYYSFFYGDESVNSFVISGFNEQNENYNYFAYNSLDSLHGYIALTDTVEFCGLGNIAYSTLTHIDFGPEYTFLWNTGSINQGITVSIEGQYSVFVERVDQCVSNTDSVYVIINNFPDLPALSDDIVQYSDASLMYSLCENPSIIYTFCPPDTFNIWFSPISPSETILIDGAGAYYTNVDAQPYSDGGQYTVTVSNENCSISACFVIIHDTVYPLEIDPSPLFVDPNIVNDTLTLCFMETSPIQVFDLLTNPNLDPTLFPDANIMTENFGLTVNGIPVPVIGGFYYAMFQALETGWYILNYELKTGYNNTCGFDTLYNQRFDSLYVIVNPLPTFETTLNYSSLLCPNGSVFLIASNTAPFLSWSGPAIDWISQTGDSAQVSLAGGYSYGGSITDGITGCSSVVGASIYLAEKIPPIVLATPQDAIICPYDFVLMSVPPIYLNYNWTGPSGTNLSNQNTHLDADQGFYYCTVLDDEGCYLTTPPIEIIEYSTPYLVVEPSNFICHSGDVTISAIFIGSGNVNWLPPLSGSATSVTVNQAGWYAAEITQCGLTVVDSIQIIDGSFSVNLTASDTFICFGSPVIIQGSISQANYVWNNGIAGSSIIEVNETGFYFATVTNDFGCEATSDTIYVEFINSSAPPNNASYTICTAQDLTLTTNQEIPALWFNSNYELIFDGVSLTQFFSENTTIYVAFPQAFCPLTYGAHLINFEPPLGIDLFIDGPTMMCNTDSSIFSLDYSGEINWSINGQTIGAGSEISLTGAQIGSNSTLWAYISNACSDTVLILNLGTYPTPEINLSSFDTILCPNSWLALPTSAMNLELDLYYYGTWYPYYGDELFYDEPTTLYLVGSDANSCHSDTVAYNVLIYNSNFAIVPVYLPSCAPDSLILSTTYTDSNTVWTHGTNQIVSDTATYLFTFFEYSQIYASVVDSNGCERTDSIPVIVLMPAYFELPMDTTVCLGSYIPTSIYIEIIDDQLVYSYLDSIEILTNQAIDVLIDNGLCPTTISYTVHVVECPSGFPNVITPNGDGVNDYFIIPNAYFEPNNHLIIVNRLGSVMFETNGYLNTFNGAGISNDVYFYIYTPDAKFHKEKTIHGFLHIMR